MLATLCPCPSCKRHVRYAEIRCPFCQGALALGSPPRVPDVSRLSRIARVALGAALATACAGDPKSGPTTPGPNDPPDGGGAIAPMYGMPAEGPPPQTGPVEPEPGPTPQPEGPKDPGAVKPMYGVPPPPSE